MDETWIHFYVIFENSVSSYREAYDHTQEEFQWCCNNVDRTERDWAFTWAPWDVCFSFAEEADAMMFRLQFGYQPYRDNGVDWKRNES